MLETSSGAWDLLSGAVLFLWRAGPTLKRSISPLAIGGIEAPPLDLEETLGWQVVNMGLTWCPSVPFLTPDQGNVWSAFRYPQFLIAKGRLV